MTKVLVPIDLEILANYLTWDCERANDDLLRSIEDNEGYDAEAYGEALQAMFNEMKELVTPETIETLMADQAEPYLENYAAKELILRWATVVE